MPASVISTSEVEALRHSFVAERARLPAPEEMAVLVQARIDEEVLLREALEQGLDREDPVVQRRILENVRFLGDEEIDVTLREADGLGMRLRDPVVRLRLVNRMRLQIADAARGDGASEEDLAGAYAQRAEALRAPPRLELSQLYLGPAPALPLPRKLPLQTEDMLARSFGPAFAREVFALPPGSGPALVRSVHGVHRVWVEAREEGAPPALETVKEQLRDALLAERDARAVQQALKGLRRRHPVVVESEGQG